MKASRGTRPSTLGVWILVLGGAAVGCAEPSSSVAGAPPAAPTAAAPSPAAPAAATPVPGAGAPAGGATAGASPSPAAAPAPSSGASPSPVEVTPAARAIVEAPDRTEADRKLDPGRHPAEFLSFIGVAPGMHVAELFAGGGYTTELLARAVGPSGVVYAENPKFIVTHFGGPWSARLARPVMKNVVRVDRELDDPLPPEAKDLDLVVMNLVYHDTVWMKVDRDKMNHAVWNALKKGGHYAVIDHSARPGTGTADVQTFHRIDEATVRAEIERAGFTVAAESGFLRNPSDTRDWNDSPMAAADRRGTSDRFALLFVKP